MLPDVNQTSRRRTIVYGAYTAHTPELIIYMRGVVDAWLRLSPEDEVVKRATRQLERSEDRLRKAGEWH